MKLRDNLKLAIINAPGFGDRRTEIFEDIALLIENKVYNNKKDLDCFVFKPFSGKVISNNSETLLIPKQPDYDILKKRIQKIELLIAQSLSDYDKEKMYERIDNLNRLIS